MAVTPSQMLEIGTELPGFSLQDAVMGMPVRSSDFASRRALLVMFICNHCPYVQHVLDEIGRLASDYQKRGVGVIAINSNDVEAYPQDAPEEMKKLAESEGWEFPFLFDETQEVAKAFRAACTPDFFVFDGRGKLVYRGQLDDSRPGNDEPVTGRDVRAALDAILERRPPPEEQQPSVGCNIKWAPGNEPDYFG